MSKSPKHIFCNIDKPSITKIAYLTQNKITGINKRQGKLFCKFNGRAMSMQDACTAIHEQVEADNIVFVNSSGFPVDTIFNRN